MRHDVMPGVETGGSVLQPKPPFPVRQMEQFDVDVLVHGNGTIASKSE